MLFVASGARNGDRVRKECVLATVIGIIVAVVVTIIAVIGKLFDDGRRARRHEAMDSFIAQHEEALAKKRRQMVQLDAYGCEKVQTWNREKKYFINTLLVPYLSVIGLVPYDDKERLKELYPEFDDAVERSAQRGLENRPASNTIIDITNGQDYERFCAGLLTENGWEARVTQATGDQGADIIANYNGLRVVFQCKFYRIHEQADVAVVISNTAYTRSAESLAGTTGTILIHHDDIPALLGMISRKVASETAQESMSDEELGEDLLATYHARKRQS